MSGGRFNFDDGGSYCGGWEEGKAHGYGCCTGPKGKGEYCGSWHYGFELLGVYMWPSGNTFEGQWENGRRNGLGIESKGRWVYRGEWSQAYKGRYGVRQSLNSGAKYEGTWSSGLQDGYGQETYADGGTYQGQWVGGMRHGYGIRNSVPYNMAAIIRSTLRSSLTSLRSDHENANGSVNSVDNFGHRGGFVLNVEPPSEPVHKGILQRTGSLRRTLMQGLRLRKSDRRSNRSTATSQTSQTSSRSHASSSRPRSLPHQDSLRSTTSTLSSGSAPSSLYGDDVSYMNEEPEGELTEAYMGEWKQDKRAGYGISQRSDGMRYEGEWQNNRKHGYGITTYPDGSREEGKWKNNQLVASGKKKLFPLRSAKISDRVARAVDLANQAAELARQKADIAISRASHAKDKAQMADVIAIQAREEANRAKIYSKELSESPAGSGSDMDSKLERKKSFFNRFDRKSKLRGTVIKTVGNQLQVPEQHHNHSNQDYYDSLRYNSGLRHHESGISSAGDISPSGSPLMSRRQDKSHSIDVMMDPKSRDYHRYPEKRRVPDKLALDGSPMLSQSHSYHFEANGKSDYDDRLSYDSPYDHPRDMHTRYGRHDRSSAELTPDSGVSTLSESERSKSHRREHNDRGKLQRRGTLQRQQKFEDENARSHQEPLSQGTDSTHVTIKEPEYDPDADDVEDFQPLDDEEEASEKKKKKNKVKSKYSEIVLKSDKPPGHYRSLTGRFPDGCSITYIPKDDENEEGFRDPDLDPEGVMVVRGKNVEWSASGKMVALVLFLNLGFTVLFSQLFTQIQEMPDF
ncbi:junctophilin-1-like [Ptychodera flava]|uniref:junctophilin-1-like n=1 Tax=Ptychodera flava TaxID=63121 RepID=UPI003969FD3E